MFLSHASGVNKHRHTFISVWKTHMNYNTDTWLVWFLRTLINMKVIHGPQSISHLTKHCRNTAILPFWAGCAGVPALGGCCGRWWISERPRASTDPRWSAAVSERSDTWRLGAEPDTHQPEPRIRGRTLFSGTLHFCCYRDTIAGDTHWIRLWAFMFFCKFYIHTWSRNVNFPLLYFFLIF